MILGGALQSPDPEDQLRPRSYARAAEASCDQPAIRYRPVCRLHGGKGGGPNGERNGAYRTGRYTLEAKAERREQRAVVRQLLRLIELADE